MSLVDDFSPLYRTAVVHDTDQPGAGCRWVPGVVGRVGTGVGRVGYQGGCTRWVSSQYPVRPSQTQTQT